MNGITEKILIGLPIAVVGWFEVRIRSKVNNKRFEDYKEYIKERFDDQKDQLNRIEDHLNGK